ncbi:MAG: phosphotransferase, partial [Mariprofundaceae bacterium]|nr:phosphotransferase [Mariprofundaceae bacterium]
MDALPAHVRAFLNPDFYPHPTADIRLIQTHISWVFLTGDYAYKLKKPVNPGFLDFSTLEKRRFYCRRELELNRRLAPKIYLDVLPVGRADGEYRLGGKTDTADYCLKMRQFDQRDLLDQRLDAGTFEPTWMDTLAADIADFHKHAETAPREFGGIDALRRHIKANFQIAKQHLGTALSESTYTTLRDHCRTLLRRQAKAVARRLQQGHVRDCHGDLHLRNIALFRHKPCVFDCIEFGDEFRMIDTMNDVAFLLMDCDARGRPDLGYRFLSRYLEHTGDYDGLALLPLYLIYRACVRGKVACLLAEDRGVDEATRTAQLAEASHYFSLAES